MNPEEDLIRPDDDQVKKTADATRAALEKLINSKISSSLPVRHADKIEDAQYIRYTPAIQGPAAASGSEQRIIKVVEVQKDPLEPPRFKINKKVPNPPPSPPAPVLHSPTRKLTSQEQQDWRIPPCISNWKNARGYTIPLDKRLAADGRGLQQNHINPKFAQLSEALYITDRKAREEVELRAQAERKLAQKEKEKKEADLRELAAKAREERAGIRLAAYSDSEDDVVDSGDDEDARERDQIRHEKEKERRREKNLSRAGAEKRSNLKRERERDISEQVALGMANPKYNASELQFDQRLFNQTQGVGSGFGEEDDYAVYDKAWKSTSAAAQGIYRPSKSSAQDAYGDDLEELKKNRFVPDKAFSGADSAAKRDGPVQFEKHQEEDPFGLDKFLSEVKKKRH